MRESSYIGDIKDAAIFEKGNVMKMKNMSNNKKIIIIIVAIAVFLIARRKIELIHAPVVGGNPVIVHTILAKKQDIKEQLDYLAEVRANNQANLASRINAAVENVYVDESSVVKKGDILADLDQRGLRAKLSGAEAELAAADENLSYWKAEYDRDEDLFNNGAISQEERDRVKNSLAQALSRDIQAKKNVDYFNADLSYAKIMAPFDGVVAKRMVDPGDLATIGKILFVVNDESRMKLVFEIPQNDISLIKKGQNISFQYKDKTFNAEVSSLFPSLANGKVMSVEAWLNEDIGFLPGEFISIKVTVLEKKDVTVIPKESVIFPNTGGPFVFMVQEGKLKKFTIQSGIITEDQVEVKNIQAGQAVVEESYLSASVLSDGQVVQLGDRE